MYNFKINAMTPFTLPTHLEPKSLVNYDFMYTCSYYQSPLYLF